MQRPMYVRCESNGQKCIQNLVLIATATISITSSPVNVIATSCKVSTAVTHDEIEGHTHIT